MNLVIGLTGPNAAGKGEVAEYLRRRGFSVHSLSDVIRQEAARRGLPPEREQLIRIGNELRREGGPGVLAERLAPCLTGLAIADSIRNTAEVRVFRKRLERFVLVGVGAPVSLRFERSLRRARAGDPRTLDDFEAREDQENSSDPAAQQLRATFELADRVLDNTGSLARLHRQVDELLAEHGLPRRSDPA